MRPKLNVFLCLFVVLAAVASCGPSKKAGNGEGAKPAPVEAAFSLSARQGGIPVRFLMAVGYLESRLTPQNATANYVALDNATDPVARGTVMTQTAFGQTFEALGLDPAMEDSQALEVQIRAYSEWVRTQVASLNLPANPRTPEEKFYWIENLANLQRRGITQRRNVQILFARELIRVLNEGFVWQDPRDGSKIALDPETPPIDIEKFPENGRNWLTMVELDSQVGLSASFLPLASASWDDEFENVPRRIEVIHCPLSLSGCLELQSRGAESDIHLAAHYVIPAFVQSPKEKDIINKVVQIAEHKKALILTNNRGESYPVTDAIVIALVGNSGRLVAGERQPAEPTWFSDRQLRFLGQLVVDLCQYMSQKTPEAVRYEACIATTGDLGVQFRHQGDSEEYRWGDIPDFDRNIFEAYIRSPNGLGTEVAFEFDRSRREFRAGETVSFNVLFNAIAQQVKVERLARCRDGTTVWELVSNDDVRGKTRLPFQKVFFDGGPNRNGEQFFRARVYGQDSRLIGWHVNKVALRDYEKEPRFASEEYCKSELLPAVSSW
jgi:hypothetical protein